MSCVTEKYDTVVKFKDPFVNLYVKDVESSAAFYSDLFGFRESFRTPKDGVPDHIELRLGDFTLGFASFEAAERVHGLVVQDGPAKGEIVLWTEDVDDAFARLVEKGAKAISPPHDFIGTLRGAWLSDLDGNNIQIMTGKFTKYGFQVHTKIRKPVSEVFDAVVDPQKMGSYFATGGVSASMKEGSTVTWRFLEFSGSQSARVKKLVEDKEIVLDWLQEEGQTTEVMITFEELGPQETLVSIKHSGYREDETGLKDSYAHCEGWTVMLSSLKGYLEYGINIGQGYW